MKEFAVVYSKNGFLYVKPFQRFESAEKEYNKIANMGYAEEAEVEEEEAEEVTEAEEVLSKEKAYYDACTAVGALWDYVESGTENEVLANVIKALESLSKHMFGEQVTI